ncbi:MAG: GGDEF domain-containing protein [Aristaeellaceae bacterium]
MEKRKRIAALMAGVDQEYQHALTQGMARATRAAGADLCIFNCQGRADGFVRNDRGERAIFHLPDLRTFDGAVVLLATIPTKICRDQIRTMLDQCPELPLVTIDVRHGHSIQVGFDDAVSVKELVRHMLDTHGVKHVALVTGPRESQVTAVRHNACLEVLRERGISLSEDAVYEGRWEREGGRAAAEHFLRTMNPLPDAILCANDDMAFGVIEGVREAGLRVPHDILVTGFDARQEAVGRGITTIRRPVQKAGELAVETLLDWMRNGRPQVNEIMLPTQLIYGDSCGCPPDTARAAACVQLLSDERRLMEKRLRLTTELTSSLSAVTTAREVGERLTEFSKERKARSVHVCVVPTYMSGETQPFPETYPQEMLLLSGWSLDGECMQQRFPTRQLLPRLEQPHDEPLALVFAPLHYMDNNIGYTAFDVEHVVNGILPTLMMMMSSSFLSLYLRSTVQNYMATLELMSIHDALTGLYNRRGMNQQLPPVFEQAQRERRPFAVICCDMDDLKSVNDRYGHQAGDQAICRLSRAIRVLEEQGLTCIHISGDEFFVVGIPNQNASAETLRDILRASVDRLNRSDPWLCDISVSMGAYVAVPGEEEHLEDFIRYADNLMYVEKHGRHHRSGWRMGRR